MIALGVDPGTRRLGWGVVSRHGNRIEHIAHGVIKLRGEEPLATRLAQIERELCEVLGRFKPEVGSVETLFFHKDAQAAAKLGHARGVVLMALARAKVGVFEYAPARVKRTLTGSGQADKRRVALMIRAVLNLETAPVSDAADALALAVTHLRVGPSLAFERLATARARSSAPPAILARLGPRGRRAGRIPSTGL
ncbi:MAG TPA: crossover junction endodeoxyribonuclease RuvC [Polyangiaceae bacterium]